MTENVRPENVEKDIRRMWRAVFDAIDNRQLRACLPVDFRSITLTDDQLHISIESGFKTEYCERKMGDLQSAIAKVIGPREIIISEGPLSQQTPVAEKAGGLQERIQQGLPARIPVMGVGDGGVNGVDRMRAEQFEGVRLIAVDTDKQVLDASTVVETLQLGQGITGGRGTGGDVDKGRKAAAESRWEVARLVREMDLVFITAGFGGGTGSVPRP